MSQTQTVMGLVENLLGYAVRFAETTDAPHDGDCWASINKAQALLAALSSPPSDLQEQVMDAVGASLGDAYDCTRVWSAWAVGTMSQDDFVRVADDNARLAEIADAAIAVMEQSQIQALLSQPIPPHAAVELLEETDSYLREIRAENLDGSEPELEGLLERVTSFWVSQNQGRITPETEARETPTPTDTFEIVVHVNEDFEPDEGDAFDAVVAALEFADIPTVVVQRKVSHGIELAQTFMAELLDSVESLGGIADEHGARTLADLMYLQHAILKGGFIDHYPAESAVMQLVLALPSGRQWASFIKVE